MDENKRFSNVLLRSFFLMILPLLAAISFMILAWFSAKIGDSIGLYIFLTASIITSLAYPALLIIDNINSKLDERFDRLEEVLKDKKNEPKGEKSENKNKNA